MQAKEGLSRGVLRIQKYPLPKGIAHLSTQGMEVIGRKDSDQGSCYENYQIIPSSAAEWKYTSNTEKSCKSLKNDKEVLGIPPALRDIVG